MIYATEVFVPSDFPTITYVEREDEKLERRVRDAIETPRSPISISGPSKTGKTALIRKIVGDDNLIHIFGTQIESPNDLWDVILNWMSVPSTTASTTGTTESLTPSGNASAQFGIPAFGSISLSGGVSTTTAANSNVTSTQQHRGMAAVAREIANSAFIVFLDDFHYIPRELQEAIGRQIKAGSEAGIRFCIDIDTSFWTEDDLGKIADLGFKALRVQLEPNVTRQFAKESCTSPQIMQGLCLQLCFNMKLRQENDSTIKISVGIQDIKEALEQTSSRADYTSLVKQMHTGPRVRGTERKEFDFIDGSKGDAYRACLLALSADPPAMEFNYADLQARISSVCKDDKPVGSSITESLKQIAGFADQMHPTQRIAEWDPEAASGTFAIIDPYFLFFIRSSEILNTLGVPKVTAEAKLL